MANYLLLFSGGKMAETETEQKRQMDEWMNWFGKLGSAMVDRGNPFTPMAKAIASDGKISDVPMATMASGYAIIKANSLDAAVALARSCPVLKMGARIAVYETLSTPGM